MAQGKEAPIAANVLGTIGTVLWCVQLVPQIWYNWRRKDTSGLPSLMIFSWGLCMFLTFKNVPFLRNSGNDLWLKPAPRLMILLHVQALRHLGYT